MITKYLDLEVGETFRHKSSNNLYGIIGFGALQTSNELDHQMAVIYTNSNEDVFIRPYSQFTDGRFKKEMS